MIKGDVHKHTLRLNLFEMLIGVGVKVPSEISRKSVCTLVLILRVRHWSYMSLFGVQLVYLNLEVVHDRRESL